MPHDDKRVAIADVGEFGFIARMTEHLTQPTGVYLGPGDDAAVLAATDKRVVVSCDMYVDTIHFRRDWATGEQIGRRCAIAAMADIFAMGALPTGLVVGLAAPPDIATELLIDMGRGIATAAESHGAGLVGGDMARSSQLMISITVLGDLRGQEAVTRAGARPGQVLALAGRLGWAAAGLDVLSRGFRSPVAVADAYRIPQPPLPAGPIAAAAGASAMMDVSDGLLADLGHIAAASQVSIDIASAALPIPPKLVEVGAALGKDPRQWIFGGGEDHALVATFPEDVSLPPPWLVIGHVIAPDDSGPAVTIDGEQADPAGWEHFRPS